MTAKQISPGEPNVLNVLTRDYCAVHAQSGFDVCVEADQAILVNENNVGLGLNENDP